MSSLLKYWFTHLAVLGLLAAPGCAQERQEKAPEAKSARGPRRLESVTWNSVKRELTWVISRGERDQKTGAYKPLSMDTYLINMDKATMTFNGETRGFSKQEAMNVTALLDIIAKYAIESTLWWDQGHGRRVNEKDEPAGGVTRVGSERPQSPSTVELVRRIAELERLLRDVERGRGAPVLRPAVLVE